MSVASRAEHVRSMVNRLEAQLGEARAAGHDVVGTSVFVDERRAGPWCGWRGAWESSREYGSTHHVVLQDDIRFCADLPAALVQMVSARPESVISGFLPRKSVDVASSRGVYWVRTRRFLWAQCVVMPTALGNAALEWIDAIESTPVAAGWKFHDDVRLAAYFTSRKIPVFVPVPHPVEHVADEIGGSVLGHNGSAARRRARAWLGEHVALADYGWGDTGFVRE